MHSMDRTNEYTNLIYSYNRPQTNPKKDTPFKKMHTDYQELTKILTTLEKIKHDPSFTDNCLSKAQILLNRLRESGMQMKIVGKTEHEKMHLEKIKNATLLECNKLTLKMNKVVKRKMDVEEMDIKRREGFTFNPELEQELKTEESVFVSQENEMARKRIIKQMNELGQIVSDISLHIAIQGEEISRIDQLVDNANGLLRDGMEDIYKLWNNIDGRKKTMLKFFAFWITVAFVFLYFRRN